MLPFDVVTLVRAAGYAGIVAIVFVETGLLVGFFLPGDSLLFTAGFLASQGVLDIRVLGPLCFIAAVAGDAIGYALGYRAGRRLFQREGSALFNRRHLAEAEAFFARHGGKAVVLARFLPIIRTFTPVIAGVGAMPYPRFAVFNVLGALLWAVGVTLGGYFLGSLLPGADRYLLPAVLVIVVVSTAPSAWHLWPACGPAIRSRLGGTQARLALAVALGLAAHFLALGVFGRSGPLPGEPAVAQLLTQYRNPLLDAISGLASLPVWTALVLLLSGGLWRRGAARLSLLLAGSDLSAEAVAFVAKTLAHRPRPLADVAEDLVATASFPSGHVVRATVTLGVLLAVLVWRHPKWRAPALVVTVGFLGLLGVALVASGEHWPSDALGGYILGALWLDLVLLAYFAWPGQSRSRADATVRGERGHTPASRARLWLVLIVIATAAALVGAGGPAIAAPLPPVEPAKAGSGTILRSSAGSDTGMPSARESRLPSRRRYVGAEGPSDGPRRRAGITLLAGTDPQDVPECKIVWGSIVESRVGQPGLRGRVARPRRFVPAFEAPLRLL